MSLEALDGLEQRIAKIDRARRRLARRRRKLQAQADAIGSVRTCTSCEARVLQPRGGQLPDGWTVDAVGDKDDEHQYYCGEHRDSNPAVNPAIAWGHLGHASLYG